MAPNRFQNEKEQTLRKLATIDKSKKGSVDQKCLPILDLLNKKEGFYTTSSCSGRILVMTVSKTRRKDQSEWLYTTHDRAETRKVKEAIAAAKTGMVWLKQESAIFHVACEDIASAERLLEIVRGAGFKRAGIISTGRRVMIEIIGTDAVAIPLGKAGAVKADAGFIGFAVKECNQRMKTNEEKIEKLTAALKGSL